MNKPQVEKGFDRLSAIYNGFSRLFFGRQLINAQDFFIKDIEDGSSILIVGGGTGKVLSEIIKSHSFSAITFLDISSGMISKAKEYMYHNHKEHISKIKFIQGTYEQLPSPEIYHVIITPFVLDCLDDKVLGNTLTALHSKLEYNGQWLFTDFNVPPKPFFIKWLSKGLILLLYSFFNLFCKLGMYQLPDFSKHFSRLFVQPQDSNYFLRGMVVTQRYIKSTG